eukprot:scaffold38_cov415-Prasinococcus_capsulatus_cf.AAC.1
MSAPLPRRASHTIRTRRPRIPCPYQASVTPSRPAAAAATDKRRPGTVALLCCGGSEGLCGEWTRGRSTVQRCVPSASSHGALGDLGAEPARRRAAASDSLARSRSRVRANSVSTGDGAVARGQSAGHWRCSCDDSKLTRLVLACRRG